MGLRAVWKSLADGEVSYLPAHASGAPETGVTLHVARWQQLLDLIDERTGTSVDDIWNEWVVDAAQRPLMQDRATARTEYAALATQAGDWNLPRDLRLEMSSWQFADAESEIGVASKVLADRGQIAALAGALGLTPPRALQTAFEGGGGIAVAATRHERAQSARPDRGGGRSARQGADPFEAIGLLGSTPTRPSRRRAPRSRPTTWTRPRRRSRRPSRCGTGRSRPASCVRASPAAGS